MKPKFDTDTVIKNNYDEPFEDDGRELIFPDEKELKITGWYYPSKNGKLVYQLVYVDEDKKLYQETIINDPKLKPIHISKSEIFKK